MRVDESSISSVVVELSHLQYKPETLCQFVLEEHEGNIEDSGDWADDDFVFVMFSDIVNRGGDRLYHFIIDNGLGVIHRTRDRRNPNTDNTIRVFVWQPIWDRLESLT